MTQTKALIISGDGINCEEETAYAFQLAGALTEICHIQELIENPQKLSNVQILAMPGGFSFADDISSGKVLALKLKHYLSDTLLEFIQQDKLVIGICNGFQALVKLGILPNNTLQQQVTLTHNQQRRFINKWVGIHIKTQAQNNVFLKNITDGEERFMLPIRHGEGRLVIPSNDREIEARIRQHIALTYDEDINGSYMNAAALLNEKGNVLGLMPHPEAFVRWSQHPAWNAINCKGCVGEPNGLKIFKNMIEAIKS